MSDYKIYPKQKVVILKETSEYKLVIVSLTEELFNSINKTKKIPSSVTEEILSNKITNSISNIRKDVSIINTKTFKDYHLLVEEFPKRLVDFRNGVDSQFRDYTQSKERQLNIQWLVKSWCTDPSKSWKSLIKVIGDYGIVFKVNH